MGPNNAPMFSGTFTLHALTPLYHPDGPLSSLSSLKSQAERLRTYLKRDSLLPNAVNDAASSKAGLLRTCTWTAITSTTAWKDFLLPDDDDDDISNTRSFTPPPHGNNDTFGILISLTYSTAQTYTAILIHNSQSSPADPTSPDPIVSSSSLQEQQQQQQPGFQSYPLLLCRLPTPIRTVLLAYLTTTFDTFPSPLKLPSAFISRSLDTYLSALTASPYTYALPTDVHETASRITSTIKDLQLSFAFPTASPALKTLDVTVGRNDTVKFLARSLLTAEDTSSSSGGVPRTGPIMTPASSMGNHNNNNNNSPNNNRSGGNSGSGNNTTTTTTNNPFMTNLLDHLRSNTAIDFEHEAVRLTKVSCSAFVLGGPVGEGGRVKFLAGGRVVGGDDGNGNGHDDNDNEGMSSRSEDEAARRANMRLIADLVGWAKEGHT